MPVRRPSPLFCAAALLLAGACDGGAEPVPERAAPAAGADYKAKVDALAEGQRNALFLRAIRDAGQDCQHVIGSAYGGEQFGMPSWVARCGDGADWLIMLGKDGTAKVARRGEQPAPR